MELLANESAHRWALRRVLRFLDRHDVTCFAVSALDVDAHALAQWLLHGDAWHATFDEVECLDLAAIEGCWAALRALLKPRRRLSTGKTRCATRTVHKSAMDPLGAGVALTRTLALQRRVAYEIPVDAAYAAARRGDLPAVQTLAQLDNFNLTKTIKQAAIARQLHVVQWLVDTTEQSRCHLRLEASGRLGAICWGATKLPEGSTHCFTWVATRADGYRKRKAAMRINRKTPEQFPLADAFAAVGDIESLEIISLFEKPKRFFTADTLVQAAQNGHVEVVEWLLAHPIKRVEWDVDTALLAACARGALDIVAMLFPLSDLDSSKFAKPAVENGHVDILRWFNAQSSVYWHSLGSYFVRMAISSKRAAALEFFHKECGLSPIPFTTPTLPRKAVGDLATVQYVLTNFGMVAPADHEAFILWVAMVGTMAEMEFTVNTLGLWSAEVFATALQNRHYAIPMASFLLNASNERDDRPIEFDKICLVELMCMGPFQVGTWVVEHAPQVDVGGCGFAPSPNFKLSWRRWFYQEQGDLVDLIMQKSEGLEEYLLAVLKHRPETCWRGKWLPELAIRVHSFESFELLREIGHPDFCTAATQHLVIKYSRDARFMVALFTTHWESMYTHQALRWAAKHDLHSVLRLIASNIRTSIELVRIRFLRTAVSTAALYGHVDVLHWIFAEVSSALSISTARVFRGVAASAVRYGHLHVLEWLLEQNLMTETDGTAVVRQAARYGQTKCLNWATRQFQLYGVNVPVLKLKCAVEAGELELSHYVVSRLSWQELADDPRLCVFVPPPRDRFSDCRC